MLTQYDPDLPLKIDCDVSKCWAKGSDLSCWAQRTGAAYSKICLLNTHPVNVITLRSRRRHWPLFSESRNTSMVEDLL